MRTNIVYHPINDQNTHKYMKLYNYIQDLIDKGDIEVDVMEPHNSNNKIKMY